MKKLAILGASGHGKVVADTATLLGWNGITFFDDDWPQKSTIACWEIAGNTQTLFEHSLAFDGVVVAIGDNIVRLNKIVELREREIPLPVLVHPTASVSKLTKVGEGSVILPGAIINAGCVLGVGCIVNSGAIVEHDCELMDGVHVSPAAALAGGVVVGEGSWIGIGASVRQNIVIKESVIVGAGSVVVKDVSSRRVVFGNPAIKRADL